MHCLRGLYLPLRVVARTDNAAARPRCTLVIKGRRKSSRYKQLVWRALSLPHQMATEVKAKLAAVTLVGHLALDLRARDWLVARNARPAPGRSR